MTKLGRLLVGTRPTPCLFVCDIQDRFRTTIWKMDAVIHGAKILVITFGKEKKSSFPSSLNSLAIFSKDDCCCTLKYSNSYYRTISKRAWKTCSRITIYWLTNL